MVKTIYSIDFATLKLESILRSISTLKYTSAEAVLPEDLLKEVQKYVQGQMVYIPNSEGSRKKWGEKSGNRNYLNLRNGQIRQIFDEGSTIDQLSKLFSLSHDSIKKIVYSKNI
jgi:Mor family transcriptional regulator